MKDGRTLAFGAVAVACVAGLAKRGGSRVVTPLGLEREAPIMDREHLCQPEVREATPYVRRAMAGKGKELGQGNFGRAVLVGGRLVKLPADKDMHGRKWEIEGNNGLRMWFRHEAGTANELHDIGIVPEVVYVEVEGQPALVREYGEPLRRVTDADYVALETGLMEIQQRGWDVSDELLVMRRKDGSLFIADAGFWFKKKASEFERWTPDWVGNLRRWVETWRPSLAGLMTFPVLENEVSLLKTEQKFTDLDRAKGKVDSKWDARMRERRLKLLGQIAKRQSMGLPAPDMPPLGGGSSAKRRR